MKGNTYIGKGDLKTYSDVILNNDRENWFVSSVKNSPGSIVVCLKNRSSFIATLLSARPKSIIWSFKQNSDSVIISNDIFLYSWYILIFFLSCAIWPPLLKFALDNAVSRSLLSIYVFLSSMALLAFSCFLLCGESGLRTNAALEALQSVAQSKNEVLTKMPRPRLGSHPRHVIYLASYILAISGVVIMRSNISVSQLLTKHNFVALLLISCVLLTAAFMIMPKGGLLSRLGQMLPGFNILVGVLFLSVVISPWKTCAEGTFHKKLNFLHSEFIAFNESAPSSLSTQSANFSNKLWQAAINKLRRTIICLFLFSFAFIMAGICYIVNGIRFVQLFTPEASRISRFSGKNITMTKAASGAGFLTAFRIIFGGVWLSLGILVQYWVIMNGVAFISALAGPEQLDFLPTSQWIHVSQQVFALAITGQFESAIVFALIRIGWLLGCGIPVLLVGISIIQLMFQRRRQYQDLLQRINKGGCVSEVVRDMASMYSMKPPRISIRDSKDINAWAYEFGLFRRKRFVEITSGAIAQERITPGFLSFVIGHELSHLSIGHVSWLNWLRWFGRLTFVGDTFALTLFNSWDCEKAADLYVLRNSNIHISTILGCLEILHLQNLIRSENDNKISINTENNLDGAIGFAKIRNYRQRIKNSIQFFIDHYTNAFSHSYWHPNILDRILSISMKKNEVI